MNQSQATAMSQAAARPGLELWDSAWSSLPTDEVQLFTRGTPRNIHAFRQRCYFEDIWPYIRRSRGKGKYLEVGAGRGTTSMYLASRGCDVTLLDYSPAGLEVARRNFAREGLAAPRTVVADARRTGLDTAAYDCVYSMGLLEHFDDPKPVLDEILRLLKPGGYLFTVVVPRMPSHVLYLTYGMFAPWKLAPLLLPRPVKAWAKGLLGRQPPSDLPFRTEFSAPDYIAMLPEDRVTDVFWCPYCPYHEVYRSRLAERLVLLPAYRLHYALRRRFVQPTMRASAGLAEAFLLTLRKR